MNHNIWKYTAKFIYAKVNNFRVYTAGNSGGACPPELTYRIYLVYFFVSASHFLIEAALAAPANGLPSLLTALSSQEGAAFAPASFSHFLMEAVLAAPAKGLPSLLTALASQLASAAQAMLTQKIEATAAMISLCIFILL
jgi:hypothetical protein